VAVKTDCSNILVENCTFSFGEGAAIGTTAGSSSNITFRNIFFNQTTCGARIKSQPKDSGLVQNVTYHNLTMYHVKEAISLNMFCHGTGYESNNIIRNVTFSDFVLIDTRAPTFFFNCSSNNPCTDIVLRNITSVHLKSTEDYIDPCVSIRLVYENVSPGLNGTETSGVLDCPPANTTTYYSSSSSSSSSTKRVSIKKV